MLDFERKYAPDLSNQMTKENLERIDSNDMMKLAESLNGEFADRLKSAIIEAAEITNPSSIRIMNGSEVEQRDLINMLKDDGTLLELNQQEYPNSYLHRSNPQDVARSEGDTYICTSGSKEDVGPTNNWMHSDEAKQKLYSLLKDSMRSRTMYVIPYWLGPIG